MPANKFTLGPNQKILVYNSNPYYNYGTGRSSGKSSRGEFNTPAQARKEVSKMHKQGTQAIAVKNPKGGVDVLVNWENPFIGSKKPVGVRDIKRPKRATTKRNGGNGGNGGGSGLGMGGNTPYGKLF